ncbi:hypothetical protein AVEN_91117-1 [Araneus ventricosus]|uniref:Secreted protein n=1 Tax=Araneus ventricosus TaxID=182803 RepID=A0A4Y2QGX6_ARAVE|nr:hypothetical protein AVEN_91117-1 [Araneus ventricosus]
MAATLTLSAAVAVFRTGVRGARLVPRESKEPQNLFDAHRCAKPATNLGQGAPKQFSACGFILTKSATDQPRDITGLWNKRRTRWVIP